jgi:hypothetical protein
MDVRINNLTSNIHLTDARAMLTPEVLQKIVDAVLLRLREAEQERRQREQDTSVDRRATALD